MSLFNFPDVIPGNGGFRSKDPMIQFLEFKIGQLSNKVKEQKDSLIQYDEAMFQALDEIKDNVHSMDVDFKEYVEKTDKLILSEQKKNILLEERLFSLENKFKGWIDCNNQKEENLKRKIEHDEKEEPQKRMKIHNYSAYGTNKEEPK